MLKTRLKRTALQVSGGVADILPLGVLVGIKWEQYAPKESTGLQIGFGLGLVLFCAFLIFARKMKMDRLCVVFGILAILSFVVSSVGMQMYQIFAAAFAGLAVDEYGIQMAIHKMDAKLEYETKMSIEQGYQKEQLKKQEKAERKKITL